MTTPAPDRITPDELREQFGQIHAEIADLHQAIAALRTGLQQAATAPASTGATKDFIATSLIMTYDDKGQPCYKVQGIPFTKFGVRVWPETLPLLGIDPATLKPGPNAINIQVRALMVNHTGDDGQTKQVPQKIIGKA